MQTVYVAGGAGFIGSNLCEKLLKDGYTVICIDNLLTSSQKTIESLTKNPQFHFLEQDVTTFTPESFADVPKPDFIFHLASPVQTEFAYICHHKGFSASF